MAFTFSRSSQAVPFSLDALPGSDDHLDYTSPPGYGTQAIAANYDDYDDEGNADTPPARIHRDARSSGSRDRSRSILPARAHSHHSNASARSRSQSIVYVSSDSSGPRTNNTTMMREQNLDIRELKLQSHQITTKLDELK